MFPPSPPRHPSAARAVPGAAALPAWALAFAACLLLVPRPVRADAAVPERIASRLVAEGFENVDVREENGAVTVWFENRIYRYDLPAIGAAAYLAARELPAEQTLELIPLNRSMPILSLSAPGGAWLSFLEGKTPVEEFRGVLRLDEAVRVGGGKLSPPHPERANASRWRTDVEVRPLFDFSLGVADHPFEYSLYAAPEAVMSPLKGFLITLQAGIRLHDDLDPCGPDDPCGKAVKPIRNTLSWGGWLPHQVLVAASAGTFPGDRWGFAGQAGKLLWDGQIEVWAGGDVSGNLQFLKDVVEYSSLGQWTAYLAATHRPRGIDLESTVTVGRFREERAAVRVDVARRFHEFKLGFFGIANKDATVAGVQLNLPLPVKRYLRPSAVRPTTVPEFPFTYRDSRESIGIQVSQFDNMDRLRKRLYPSFIRNDLEDLREAVPALIERGGS